MNTWCSVPYPGQQVAQAIGSDGALYGAEIRGAGPAPRNFLNGDCIADGFNGAYQGYEYEGRKERPECGAELKIETRPTARIGKSDPGGIQHSIDIIDAEAGGYQAAQYNPDHRRPETPYTPGAQRHYQG